MDEGRLIVCLGWGSLIWDPRDLPLRQPVLWYEDGPALPIEFARKSQNGRITLVLLDEGPAVPMLWSQLDVTTIDEARTSLAHREECGVTAIGCWPSKGPIFEHTAAIGQWASSRGITGVVWTALPPLFDGSTRVATADQIVGYLRSLTGSTQRLAREYVCKTPTQVKTPYRMIIERTLGWTPT